MLGEARHVAAQDAGIHAELRLRECAAGRDFCLEALWLPAGRRIDWRIGRANEEFRAAVHLTPVRQIALVAQYDRRLRQANRIEIEYGLGVRLIALLGIVAFQ